MPDGVYEAFYFVSMRQKIKSIFEGMRDPLGYVGDKYNSTTTIELMMIILL